MSDYQQFLERKMQLGGDHGFDPLWMPDSLYPFQRDLVEWALRKGRAAIFADCGLGKTPMQLVWADNVVRKTGGRVLILTPLAVAQQTAREAEKFGVDAVVSRDGKWPNGKRIIIANYERLHYFGSGDFAGVVCDESGILKNYAGKTRDAITKFVSPVDYRLLCTATPAPNDYMELGTSCEALGVMRRVEMLAKYFTHDSGNTQSWVLKGHGEKPFWRFLASWSRAIRRPSDIGDDTNDFILPELLVKQITLPSTPRPGELFVTEAIGLEAQRTERRISLSARCERVAEIANGNNDPFLAWCSLNSESEEISRAINGAVELRGSDDSDDKERKLIGFVNGDIRCLVTKPSIAGHGMNLQHCNQMSFFPSHSHEQYYQSLRRCWRFGQRRPVTCWIVTTEAESSVLQNMKRKEAAADHMFESIVANMRGEYRGTGRKYITEQKVEMPKWISGA